MKARTQPGSVLMRHATRMLALAAVLLLFAAAGCSPAESTTTTGAPGGTAVTDPPISSAVLAPPGLYDLGDGRWQALGVLRYVPEDDRWVVAQMVPGEGAESGPPVIVLNAVDLIGDRSAQLEGSYVAAEGTLEEGAEGAPSGTSAVLRADSIEEVTDMQVAPQE